MANLTPQQTLYALADRVGMSVAVGTRFLPADDQATFRGLASPETGWTLGLLLTGWYVSRNPDLDGPGAAELLKSSGADSVYAALDGYAHLLNPFLNRARDASSPAQLAAAGSSFAYAAGQIGVGFLRMVVSSGAFAGLRSLAAKFPPPAGFRERYLVELGASSPRFQVSPTSVPPMPGAVAMTMQRPDVPDVGDDSDADDSDTDDSDTDDDADDTGSIPAPRLSNADACAAHLHAMGVAPGEIARLCAGPRKVGSA